MLRDILLIVALGILLAIGPVWLGLLDLNQTQNAQAPKFEVKVNDVKVGTTTRQIETPTVTIDKGNESANAQ